MPFAILILLHSSRFVAFSVSARDVSGLGQTEPYVAHIGIDCVHIVR